MSPFSSAIIGYVRLWKQNISERYWGIADRKINDRPVKNFERAEEKGYFSYGCSTIILILQKGKVKIDSDITERKCETLVRLGEGIGTEIRREE